MSRLAHAAAAQDNLAATWASLSGLSATKKRRSLADHHDVFACRIIMATALPELHSRVGVRPGTSKRASRILPHGTSLTSARNTRCLQLGRWLYTVRCVSFSAAWALRCGHRVPVRSPDCRFHDTSDDGVTLVGEQSTRRVIRTELGGTSMTAKPGTLASGALWF
jgi:hypothetical protein